MRKAAYIHDDFMLACRQARDLYHSFAEPLPIIDYHSHLPPAEIAGDRNFENPAQAWLAGDHYKWRAMRACGVDERFITGGATDREKFEKWAWTVPQTLRNPLHHWTHLELRRPFGITDRLLNPRTAKDIWEECNARLKTPGFSTRGILKRMNVEVVCTTDDPVDSLEHHRKMAADPTLKTRVFPTFRPDRAMAVDAPPAFARYVAKLAEASDMKIRTYDDFVEALRKRHDHFHRAGARLSDHGMETLYGGDWTGAEVRAVFARALRGKRSDDAEVAKFRSALLHELALMDREKGWVQQYHIGPLRDTRSRMKESFGADAGCDSIGDRGVARDLAKFLDRLDAQDKLARTILYNLNPRDNEVFAAMAGSFQDGSAPGKMQHGPAWWFMDQLDGMTRHLEALSNLGLLGQFVGMTTDSRSFLSFPRHEYFRRLLCGILGREMAAGLLPDDRDLVGRMVGDICYFNAKRYFPFPGRAGRAP